MEELLVELLHHILLHLPTSSVAEFRLVCRSLSGIAFPILFSFVPQWLDFEMSRRSVIALAHDAYNRLVVMWSPWATGPDGSVDQVWMEIVWKLLVKSDAPGLVARPNSVAEETNDISKAKHSQETVLQASPNAESLGNAGEVVKVRLTSVNFAALSGKEDMTENRLRTG